MEQNNAMSWVDQVKEALPDYAKDVRLNLDSVIKRSSISEELASACALAAAFATGNQKVVSLIQANIADEKERDAALAASSVMAMTNIWYPYVEMVDDQNLKGLPAQIRMNTIASHGGTTKANFEAFSLAASIVGKCRFCVKAHYDSLKTLGYTVEQLRDIGRIAAVMTAVCRLVAN